MAEIEPEDAKVLIRFLRSLHDWSQADLAERSGIAESTLRRYETGETLPSGEVVERLAAAARVPSYLLHGSLLSALHFVRKVVFPRGDDPADYRQVEESVEWCAREAAELARGHYRKSWIEAVRLEEERKAEEAAKAWRPVPADREEALLLWERLEPCNAEERAFLLDSGAAFRSWALVEKIADRVAAQAAGDPGKALEEAELALEIARRVPGEEGWPDRVQGYACAALARAQGAAGREAEAGKTAAAAREQWRRGAGFPGLLEEEGFRTLVGELVGR